MRGPALVAAVVVWLALHNDFWLWTAPDRLFGLPLGLTYHVLYCVASAAVMAALVRWGWDHLAGLDDDGGRDAEAFPPERAP